MIDRFKQMTSSSQKFTYLSLLGLSKGANAGEIKKAFIREAKRWHPDLNGNDETAALRFKLINESYCVLKDPQRRHQWEISGKPTFEIPETKEKPQEILSKKIDERSTNGDTSFNSREKLLLFAIACISMFFVNNFFL